jgi:16S rRNA (cytidine1402-2'-O)-methyltransferase
MSSGKLYLIPTTLGSESTKHVIPSDVAETIKNLRYFAVEDLKSARRYLRKIDREFPIDDSTFFILKKDTPIDQLSYYLKPIKEGHSIFPDNVEYTDEYFKPNYVNPYKNK